MIPKRRWFRYSLRTFLLVIAALCVWLGIQVNAARRQREAVAAITKAGGKVLYDWQVTEWRPFTFSEKSGASLPAGAWLRWCLGDDFFQTVVEVKFFGRNIPESTLAQVSNLRDLKAASFTASWIVPSDSTRRRQIEDADLARLAQLTSLEDLGLDDSNVKGAGLADIAKLKELRVLRLKGAHVDDKSLEQIRGLTKMMLLDLGGTRVTDHGIEQLRDMTNLECLFLDGTAVTGAGLGQLASKPLNWLSIQIRSLDDTALEQIGKIGSLETLILDTTAVTDAGLAHLQKLGSLGGLTLRHTSITDAGLANLKGLTSLHKLDLEGSKVTPAGIGELRKSLPKLYVTGP